MILKCRECGKMISVSKSGYGEKNALAGFMNEAMQADLATRWMTCGQCHAPYCYACAQNRKGLFRKPKCECGGGLSEDHNQYWRRESAKKKIIEEYQDKKEKFNQWMKKGAEHYNEKEYQDAVKWIGKAIDIYPEKAGAGLFLIRANSWRELGERQKEIQDLNKAIELDPDKYILFQNRGFAYFETGDYVSALEDFSQMLELAPDSGMAYNNRGVCHERLGRINKAKADYRKALELDPEGEAGRLARQNLDMLD